MKMIRNEVYDDEKRDVRVYRLNRVVGEKMIGVVEIIRHEYIMNSPKTAAMVVRRARERLRRACKQPWVTQ